MTPALKAMVEAMAAEFERQVEENRGQGWDAGLTGGPSGECRIDGRFELEKVARAGLDSGILEAAFREGFTDGQLKAGEDRGRYDAPGADEAWAAYRASLGVLAE